MVDYYLLANWATRGNSAPVVCTRAGIALGHLLTILPPLTPIVHLHQRIKRNFVSSSDHITYNCHSSNFIKKTHTHIFITVSRVVHTRAVVDVVYF